ncbi:serine aminopeptidase domain-containing protein [Bartonella vinsonii]|uniref:Lysophospholipase L2 n=1 Tax=Bartonella vinsonii subsp. berkhoffii str. Tweed TaxID=1094502 RepID=N6VPN5_BARVB|nr:alpha/beta hydrolase [Bartonella vinsonii]ENN95106.1 lysophospholipase L2 [Bartonella vinsonii subsp. berkhoffii str. Tweed]
METPIYCTNWNSIPPHIWNNSLKTAIDREIRFAITHPEIRKSKGTVVILERYADSLEEYFLPMNEISKRCFHTAIFDWFGGKKSPSNTKKQSRYHYFDINNNINDLDEFLKNVVYPNCPSPYYMLTYGIGGLIALSGLDLINHQFKRMLCVSPLFAPFGNKTNGFQHKLTQLLTDIGLGFLPAKGGKKLKQTQQKNRQLERTYNTPFPFIKNPTSQWMTSVLNAIDSMKKNIFLGHLQIPTLFILANQNNIANNIEVQQLCQQIRLTECITITGANLDTIMHEEDYKKQFWAAFDAFIPNESHLF